MKKTREARMGCREFFCVRFGGAAGVRTVASKKPRQPCGAGARVRSSWTTGNIWWSRHQPAMPWRDIPAFAKAQLRDIEPGDSTRSALLFLIFTALRSGEVRGAT
ncbi:hypothetical protein M3A49_22230 [Paraburkholderia sp. CNPSo 3076]|uniref:hypothetical protein n=1 Tax=Paraburkholderia sp. CNPSo 3076 TaxID=2940936 RepID=UPI002256AE72|nr:hypothetical protein [Paraburkholderia sp. CNPSo 3076]MCX5542184.1 hypothetical protein [Paraburkholderia sp. CNPSo 3076]